MKYENIDKQWKQYDKLLIGKYEKFTVSGIAESGTSLQFMFLYKFTIRRTPYSALDCMPYEISYFILLSKPV